MALTRNGSRAAVLLSADDYDALLETVDILSRPDLVASLRGALQELEEGAVSSVDEVRTAMLSRARLAEVTQPYQLVFTRTARRALAERLPAGVAAAAWRFIVGPLAANPKRVGKPLRPPLAPLFSARRGEYRVLYRIDDDRVAIEAVDVDHRRDVDDR
ncbi:type II toxin-antitoxin system Phd/YefM family antitoxin [Curtobacterium sp. MCBD17_019]|uniref:type II toxin-antitoxin system Phd/YefM family antitoxin n=1 Tax=Curtobacterium sp. MCBD17_019 TaxID=2175669 RepID=UPI000DAA1AE6|nr:type II toxin-antitoxin system Phd/YefM family antitoxin [Curtobacterium sp. MCBD17_019]PZE76600.1 hypothetical protein DEI82_05400 [Curtobacterium sp. MCBD17_019]